MTTSKLPGTDAARHGTGDADLTIMYVAHEAFRRDLASLARAAQAADLSDPRQSASVAAGWEMFKTQLVTHHTAEDEVIWLVLRERFAGQGSALSVLDAMEDEHEQIDPLLAAVDDAFARRRAGGRAADDWPGTDRLADMADVLSSTLSAHLAHEERDGLPLIGAGLTQAQWRAVGRRIARRNGLGNGMEMFAWMTSGAAPDRAREAMAQLPAPLRLLQRVRWAPRYARIERW